MSAGADVQLTAVGTWSLPERVPERVPLSTLRLIDFLEDDDPAEDESEAEQRADALLAEMTAAREEQGR